MVPDLLLDIMARMLPRGKGSVYRISVITLRGFNKAHKTKLKQSTLTDEEGRRVAKWLLEKIAASYTSKFGFDKGWLNRDWVSLILLGYWVGWSDRGVGTLLRNLKKKGILFTLGNVLTESKTANVRSSAKNSKNYILASNIAKKYLSERGIPVPPPIPPKPPRPPIVLPPLIVTVPKKKPKPKRAGFGLVAGLALAGLAAAIAFGKRKR